MPHANGVNSNGTRAIALVGPAGAGKTSLAEAIVFAAGGTDRHGSVANGSSIGDSSPEARSRGGSTELNLYNFDFLDDHFALIDCPGSVGFAADGARAIAVADLAIVVVDPDPCDRLRHDRSPPCPYAVFTRNSSDSPRSYGPETGRSIWSDACEGRP